jgi:hypothetical protein
MWGTVTACAAALLAVAVTGCSSASGGVQSGGPLGPPDHHDGACAAEPRPGAPETIGFIEFGNTGSVPLVITRVTLRDPRHLRLLGSYLVPVISGEIGAASGWPPRPSPGAPLPRGWKLRQPPGHLRLLPRKAAEVVVGITSTARPGGSAAGVNIYYHSGGTRYVRESNVRLMLQIPVCGG